MRLERGNLVRITDDEVKIAKFKKEGYKEVEEVNEEKKAESDKEAKEVETAESDKEAKEVETAESDKEAKEVEVAEEKAEEKKVEEAEAKKTTGRGRSRANNKK
jgi:hypothetical protein